MRVVLAADGTPGVVSNDQDDPGECSFVAEHKQVIAVWFEDSLTQGAGLKRKPRQAAERIAPLQGLPVDVVELALQRHEFNVQPVTAAAQALRLLRVTAAAWRIAPPPSAAAFAPRRLSFAHSW